MPPTARLYTAPFASYGGSKIPKFSPNLLRATIVALPTADPTPPTARLYTAPFPSYGGVKNPKIFTKFIESNYCSPPYGGSNAANRTSVPRPVPEL